MWKLAIACMMSLFPLALGAQRTPPACTAAYRSVGIAAAEAKAYAPASRQALLDSTWAETSKVAVGLNYIQPEGVEFFCTPERLASVERLLGRWRAWGWLPTDAERTRAAYTRSAAQLDADLAEWGVTTPR